MILFESILKNLTATNRSATNRLFFVVFIFSLIVHLFSFQCY